MTARWTKATTASLVLCLVALGAAVGTLNAMASRLPERIVTHWGASGQPDGWQSITGVVVTIVCSPADCGSRASSCRCS